MPVTAGAEKAHSEREQRIERCLAAMTWHEKASLLSGADDWRTVALPRLGIGAFVMTDGPHGVRTNAGMTGRKHGPAVSFPTGIAMAATWDPGLIERVGRALGEETLAMGCDVLLGPCVNIARTPLAGRNFEGMGEDPYLAGEIGAAYVRGVQAAGAGACVKHLAGNNQEYERWRGDSVIDERTLREIYLAQFERIVKTAGPWLVMCSYNRLNGRYASENAWLLAEILKREWGFDGVVVSDWGAVHSTTAPVPAGLDLEMPGPARYLGPLLVEAMRTWQVEPACVEEAARRVLRTLDRAGKLPGSAPQPAGAIDTPEHRALAAEAAAEAMTLLKNDGGLLPLAPGEVKRIAVIGPCAREFVVSGGGSAALEPAYTIGPLAGLREVYGDRTEFLYEQGCDSFAAPPPLAGDYLLPDAGGKRRIKGEFFAGGELAGEPCLRVGADRFEFWFSGKGPREEGPSDFSARWTCRLDVPADGDYLFRLRSTGRCKLYLNGRLLAGIEPTAALETVVSERRVTENLAARGGYEIVVEYAKVPGDEYTSVCLGFAPLPAAGVDPRVARAAELARSADAALVFAGLPPGYESEGIDRPDLELPGGQNDLIRAVAAANPRTAVVLNCGAPVTMPWLAAVPAVLLAWYPGQEGGRALARVVAGLADPAGRLPVTFPAKLADNPAHLNYPGARRVLYGEGIFVGYRYYDAKGVEPLFPFGHGLSYTEFSYGEAAVPAEVARGGAARIAVRVKNTGSRPGREIVQLYIRDVESALPRPPKELKGFAKVALAPGEERLVEFVLDERAFSYYDPEAGRWLAEPGEFEALIGRSSRDIRARARFTLR